MPRARAEAALHVVRQGVLVMNAAVGNVSLRITDMLMESLEEGDFDQSLNPVCHALWLQGDDKLVRAAEDVRAAHVWTCKGRGGSVLHR